MSQLRAGIEEKCEGQYSRENTCRAFTEKSKKNQLELLIPNRVSEEGNAGISCLHVRLLEETKITEQPELQYKGSESNLSCPGHYSGSAAFLQHQCYCDSGKSLAPFRLKASVVLKSSWVHFAQSRKWIMRKHSHWTLLHLFFTLKTTDTPQPLSSFRMEESYSHCHLSCLWICVSLFFSFKIPTAPFFITTQDFGFCLKTHGFHVSKRKHKGAKPVIFLFSLSSTLDTGDNDNIQ